MTIPEPGARPIPPEEFMLVLPVQPLIRMKSWYTATARSNSIIAAGASQYSSMSRRRRSSRTTTKT